MTEPPTPSLKRIVFVEMMGEPGSYDASVYDHFEDKDQEGLWFVKRFDHMPGLIIETCNVCVNAPLPQAREVDGLVLAGSYNSVHDNRPWQEAVRAWLPKMRDHKIPILAICGSHQLLAHMLDSDVVHVNYGSQGGAYAGTFPIDLTAKGEASPLMEGLGSGATFHFANFEHVTSVPKGATLLAASGPVPIAAMDFGDHCYSTQFHPEGTHETLGAAWRNEAPALMENYFESDAGGRLVENFLRLVTRL
ncbi:MAG: type 1 glutamine amidotransferase [Pseudomonadota bacterium]